MSHFGLSLKYKILKDLKERQEKSLDEIIVFLKDKRIDQELRWNMFGKLTEDNIFDRCNCYIISFECIRKYNITYDYVFERYSEVDLLEFVFATEEILIDENGFEETDEEFITTIKSLKEEILQCGFSSMIWDW